MPPSGSRTAPFSRRGQRPTCGGPCLEMWRSICPQINQHLISAAEHGGLGGLLIAIEKFLPEMNLVNATTALHRLAKLHARASSPSAVQVEGWQFQLVEQLAARVQDLIGRSLASKRETSTARCQTAANIAWSATVLRYSDTSFVTSIVRFATHLLPSFHAFELASLLAALAELTEGNRALRFTVVNFFQMAVPILSPQVDNLKGTMLIAMVQAYTQVGCIDDRLFRAVAPCLVRRLRSIHWCSPSKSAVVARCYLQANVIDQQLFKSLAQVAVTDLRSIDVEDLRALHAALVRAGLHQQDIFQSLPGLAEASPSTFVEFSTMTPKPSMTACSEETASTTGSEGGEAPMHRRMSWAQLQDEEEYEMSCVTSLTSKASWDDVDTTSPCPFPRNRNSGSFGSEESWPSTPLQSAASQSAMPRSSTRASWADLWEEEQAELAMLATRLTQ